VDASVFGRKLVCKLARSVWAVVVYHQHLKRAVSREESLDEGSEILSFAVRRNHY
jgi:hypothetical protein